MLSLAIDTAYQYLTVCLFDGDVLAGGYSEVCFKKQSENVFPVLEELLEQAHLKLSDVKRVVITQGPGSYTGLRIAMTIAKMLGTQSDCEVDVISTMQLYAGMDECANVILDARGHRAYTAHVENGKIVWMGILDLDDLEDFLDKHPGRLYGEGHLVGKEAIESDFIENFMNLQPVYEKVENVHALIPDYLKGSDSYKV